MFGVSALTMVASAHGSYALAGAVVATGLAATAVAGPLTARLVDRRGQARVALPAAVLAAAGAVAFALCARWHAPVWTLFAAHAATAAAPNTGGMSRARWAHLHRDDPSARHTANALEQAVDELCFMLGPVLAVWLCTSLSPQAGTVAGAVLLLAGVLLFTAQRATEPPVAPHRPDAHGHPLAPPPGTAPLLAVFLAAGVVFGGMEVATIALADHLGHRASAGWMLALQATGSCAAGILYGTAAPRGTAEGRFTRAVTRMALATLLPLAGALWGGGHTAVLAACLLVAGMATAPAMTSGTGLLQARVPAARLHEGMSLLVTAIVGGIAAGQAVGGWTVDHRGPVAAYAVPVVGGGLALLTVLSRRPGRAGAGTATGSVRVASGTATAAPAPAAVPAPSPVPEPVPVPER
ncbi:MFS transporter [Streptacidiphilus sp. ASG 303]|nr:MFS transporter [Streptacidiphilus sp. ASG 303]